jgi:hypothetical protein
MAEDRVERLHHVSGGQPATHGKISKQGELGPGRCS